MASEAAWVTYSMAGPFDVTAKVTDNSGQTTDAVLSITIESQPQTSGTVYNYTVPSSGGFDAVGNITQYVDSVQGTWNFTYDNLNRLSSAIAGAGASSAYQGQNLCFNYDSFGNRIQDDFQTASCTSSNPAPVSYSAANQVSGLSYDAAGNVLYDGTNYYSYDAEGRVCAMETSSSVGALAYGYVYDAEGRRVARGTITASPIGQQPSCNLATNGFTLLESYVLGQGGEELSTLDGNSKWERTNVYGPSSLIATYDTAGLHFHVADPLGTRRLQANAQGEAEEECQSLPFGDQLNCAGTDATPLHFTGKERDQESGNDYFGARYYASSMGRFLSPDWSAQTEPVPYAKLDNPQSLNLYAYVGNNPVTGIDATGHCFDGGSSHCGSGSLQDDFVQALHSNTAAENIGSFFLESIDEHDAEVQQQSESVSATGQPNSTSSSGHPIDKDAIANYADQHAEMQKGL